MKMRVLPKSFHGLKSVQPSFPWTFLGQKKIVPGTRYSFSCMLIPFSCMEISCHDFVMHKAFPMTHLKEAALPWPHWYQRSSCPSLPAYLWWRGRRVRGSRSRTRGAVWAAWPRAGWWGCRRQCRACASARRRWRCWCGPTVGRTRTSGSGWSTAAHLSYLSHK